jgi:hypothetical protein
MTPEEIRIRSLVSIRTHEDLTYNIPRKFAFAGLYPERLMLDSNGKIIDEFKTDEFKQKIEAWPDVKAAVERYEKRK